MPTQEIFLRVCYHPGPHWIQVDVTNQFQKVAVTINQNSFVTSLKKMTGSLFPPVDPAGITERKVLHASRQGDGANLYYEVDMIGHQAECMDTVTEPAGFLL